VPTNTALHYNHQDCQTHSCTLIFSFCSVVQQHDFDYYLKLVIDYDQSKPNFYLTSPCRMDCLFLKLSSSCLILLSLGSFDRFLMMKIIGLFYIQNLREISSMEKPFFMIRVWVTSLKVEFGHRLGSSSSSKIIKDF
jgi:hypothetical protein